MKLDPNKLPSMLEELFAMWGGMHGVQGHHANCRAHSTEIIGAFETSNSANEVLAKLLHIKGISLTIATGIRTSRFGTRRPSNSNVDVMSETEHY